MTLEYVVRPFQDRDSSPPRVVAQEHRYVAPLKLVLGKTGSGKTISLSYQGSMQGYADQRATEIGQDSGGPSVPGGG
jgi:hypothetical protein